MVSKAGTCFRSHLRVYHKDKRGRLHSLQNFNLSEKIFDAIAIGKRCVKTRSFSRGDLERLAQMGLGADSEVDLVVELLWDARSLMVAVARADNARLRHRVLEMALNRIRRTPILSKILAAKGCPSSTIRENPHLKDGHPPYENFIQSLLSLTDDSTPSTELFELLLESAADEADIETFTSVEQAGVRTVFHGTNHAVMDAILKSGLDPSCRRRPKDRGRDYFGLDFETSLDYTKEKMRDDSALTATPAATAGYKLLVFMIIVEPGKGNFSFNSIGRVTVESNRLQLPLAEITLLGVEEAQSSID